MNMKRILKHICRDYGAFHIKCAYFSLELNPNISSEEKPELPSSEAGDNLSEAQIYLLSKLSSLSDEDRDALMRFVGYASGAAGAPQTNESKQTCGVSQAADSDDTCIASWLDEQARLHTQEPANP